MLQRLVLLLGAVAMAGSEEAEGGWETLPPHLLRQVYTQYDSCLLTHSGNCSPPVTELEQQCSGLFPRDVKLRELYSSEGLKFPRSLYDVPKSFSTEKEFSRLTHISDLLVTLNETNTILALFGDSVTRDSILSLVCIVGIENNFEGIQLQPPNIMSGGGNFKFIQVLISFPSQVTREVVTSRIFFCQEKVSREIGRHDAIAFQLLSTMSRSIRNSKYLFVVNAGLHLTGFNILSRRLQSLISFSKLSLMKLGKNPSANKLLYRESSTQHFDHSSGYYDFQIDSQRNDLVCVPSSNVYNKTSDYRRMAENHILKKMNVSKAQIIKFRVLSSHFDDIHPSSIFFKSTIAVSRNSTTSKDCTHFPYFFNFIYRILWYRILKTL